MLELILILVALILFALAAFKVASRFEFIAGGLFCWCLATSLALFHIRI